ncbi:hypothetical protein F4823DRAFT_583525 [Ustulina deusta]|nr:hypothetical protein F4823DRAFT_583525 [Ustulina deusta]
MMKHSPMLTYVTWYAPSETISEPRSLQRLEHFSYTRFPVAEKSLLAPLAMLPPSIRTIEPAFPDYVEGSRRSLLRQMRDAFGWRDRNARPPSEHQLQHRLSGTQGSAFGTMTKWYGVSLYEGGPNPFGQDPQTIESTALTQKKLGILRDASIPGWIPTA